MRTVAGGAECAARFAFAPLRGGDRESHLGVQRRHEERGALAPGRGRGVRERVPARRSVPRRGERGRPRAEPLRFLG